MLKDITENDIVLIPFYPEMDRDSDASTNNMTPMLVELHPKNYQANLYMKAGDRITTTSTTVGNTPTPTEETGK